MFKIRSNRNLSQEAFEAMYRDLQPKLIRYITGVLNGDVELSADVVDEAFVAFWQFKDNLEIEKPFAWLRRVARNKAIDAIRKNKEILGVGDSAEKEALDLADDKQNPEQQYEASKQRETILASLDTLSPDHREVIWLSYFEDKSVNEIAEISGAPENTIKTRLYHARKLLMGQLKASGLTP